MHLGPYVALSFMLSCGLYEKSIQIGTNDFVQKSHMVIKHCIPKKNLKKQEISLYSLIWDFFGVLRQLQI